MEIVLILIFIALLFFFYKSQQKLRIKNSASKKIEIIQNYEKQLKILLIKFENDKAKQLEEKKAFLQNCNSELSRNIFFSNEEAIKVIEKLLKI